MSFGYQVLGFGSFPNRAGGYTIENAIWIYGTADYLQKTFTSASDNNKRYIYAFWTKGGLTGRIGYAQASDYDRIEIKSTAAYATHTWLFAWDQAGSVYDTSFPQVYVDDTAWRQHVMSIDTTAGTGNRIRMWTNGVENTGETYANGGETPLNHTLAQFHNTSAVKLIEASAGDSVYFAQFVGIDGLSIQNGDNAITDFGEFDDNGVWIPVNVSGLTFGTNGFLLDFAVAPGTDDGAGTDVSGNGNHFAETSIDPAQQVIDTPTDDAANNIGNYPVWNLNHSSIDNSTSVIDSVTEGNLRATVTSNNTSTIFSTMASPDTGKYMIRFVNKDASNNSNILVGLQDTSQAMPAYNSPAGIASSGQRSVVYRFGGGYLYIDGTNSHQYTTGASADNTLDFAWDADTGKVWIAVNGTWQDGEGNTGGGSTDIAGANTGNVATLTSGYQYAIACSMWDTTSVFIDQDGGTLPTDFKRFNTANLPAPTVTKPSDFYNTVLWTGDGVAIGSGGQTITGVGFQPDFIYLKQRNSGNNGALYDSCRGVTKLIYPDLANAQGTLAEGVATINADGFIVGNNAQNNAGSATYIAFCLKAGGAPTTDNTVSVANDATMTSGSVFKGGVAHSFTPHDDATIFPKRMTIASHGGFSIIKYEGDGGLAKIPHGLDRAPTCLIVKNLDTSNNWLVQIPGDPTDYMDFDRDYVRADNSEMWNDTAPDADLITVGKATNASAATNGSGNAIMAYVFANTPGFISTGTYTGNGNVSGPVITTNFRPAWLLLKRLDGSNTASVNENWVIHDSVRNPYNPSTTVTISDSNVAETTTDSGGSLTLNVDFLATGFKIRTTSTVVNTSGSPYMYLALAENPFGGSGVAQARAR